MSSQWILENLDRFHIFVKEISVFSFEMYFISARGVNELRLIFANVM